VVAVAPTIAEHRLNRLLLLSCSSVVTHLLVKGNTVKGTEMENRGQVAAAFPLTFVFRPLIPPPFHAHE
jgi:hypothetical protein